MYITEPIRPGNRQIKADEGQRDLTGSNAIPPAGPGAGGAVIERRVMHM